MLAWVCVLAVLLDRTVTDRLFRPPECGPAWPLPGSPYPHPVSLFGSVVVRLDFWLRPSPRSAAEFHRFCGLILLIVAVCLAMTVGLMADLMALWNLWIGSAVQVVVLAVLLAGGPLSHRVSEVAIALEQRDIRQARLRLSHLVSRDFQTLDVRGIASGAIESMAENTADAFVAPLFWFTVGGWFGCPCTALCLFKAVNTLDSMVGYRDSTNRFFGWASARADDLLCFPASRITALALMVSALMWRPSRMRPAWTSAVEAARVHASVNAGWPIGLMAGLLGVRLGGSRSYGHGTDIVVVEHWYGAGPKTLSSKDVAAARLWCGGAMAAATLVFTLLQQG